MKTAILTQVLIQLAVGLPLCHNVLLAADVPAVAPFMNEREAAAAGRKLGIGSASLEGPKIVEVATDQTWTLVYTAGKAGIRPGGGIRIGMRHLSNWTPPQTDNPKAAGYFTAKTSDGHRVQISTGGDLRRLFGQYFPWQNMVEVVFPDKHLAPGDTVRLTFGDRSGGSSGVRIQPFDEPRFVFKTFVDAPGDGNYLPLEDHPSIRIVAGNTHRLNVVMPSDAVAGKPAWCIVRAEDRYGNPAVRYRGTVTFRSTDSAAGLPDAYAFT